MILIIDDYGVYIEKDSGCFLITSEDGIRKISPHRITAIHIMKQSIISTAAILLAAEHEIPLLFIDSTGNVRARIWQTHFGSIATIRVKQLRFSESGEGLDHAVHWLELKSQGKIVAISFFEKPGNRFNRRN